MRQAYRLIKKAVFEFFEDGCPSQAAALSYYTIFSLPPLLLIVITVAGSLFDASAVQGRVVNELRSLIGGDAARHVGSILANAQRSTERSGGAALLGIAALVFASTTAFVQLQTALNQAWNVKPSPQRSEVHYFFVKRLVSFGMILAIAFLTLVSLLLSAFLAAFSDFIDNLLPSGMSTTLLRTIDGLLSLTVFAGLFAAIYKYLPDVEIEWLDALTGGFITAGLFSGGKFAISMYLGSSDVVDIYGAAGSLAIILLWTYYSSMILLFGAEFTQVWTQREGRSVAPEPGAVKVRRQEVEVETSHDSATP